jgi:hypothetical protein
VDLVEDTDDNNLLVLKPTQTTQKALTVKDIVTFERAKAFEGQIASFSPVVQRTMCTDFWDTLFKSELAYFDKEEERSTTQSQMLIGAWKRRRHGLFFLREIYNESATKCARITV